MENLEGTKFPRMKQAEEKVKRGVREEVRERMQMRMRKWVLVFCMAWEHEREWYRKQVVCVSPLSPMYGWATSCPHSYPKVFQIEVLDYPTIYSGTSLCRLWWLCCRHAPAHCDLHSSRSHFFCGNFCYRSCRCISCHCHCHNY